MLTSTQHAQCVADHPELIAALVVLQLLCDGIAGSIWPMAIELLCCSLFAHFLYFVLWKLLNPL